MQKQLGTIRTHMYRPKSIGEETQNRSQINAPEKKFHQKPPNCLKWSQKLVFENFGGIEQFGGI